MGLRDDVDFEQNWVNTSEDELDLNLGDFFTLCFSRSFLHMTNSGNQERSKR